LFVDDIKLPGHYAALTVRSPAANRALKGIRCPELDPDYRLIRASDIPGQNRLAGGGGVALASERVDYIGQPVAIIVGPDRLRLEEIAAQITVETDNGEDPVRPPVFSVMAEEAETAARIMLDIEAFPKKAAPKEPKEKAAGADEAAETSPQAPPPAAGAAPPLVSGRYRTGIQEHWYSEPHGAAASVSGGGVVVYAATQWPDHARQSVAAALGLPASAVSLEEADTALHFDGKIWYPSLVAVHAALAAFVTKRTVKLMLTRMEDFLFSPKRPETVIDFSTRLDPNGEPVETAVNIRAGFGADVFFAGEMLGVMARAAAGHYRLGRITVNAIAARTHLPPAGPFAGFGAAEGAFALERHVSKIADTLRIEGAQWRARHYNEKKIPADEAENLTAELAALSDYRRKRAAYELLRREREESGARISPMRGIGLAVFAHTEGRQRYRIDGAGAMTLAPAKPDAETRRHCPLAAAVIELEIDGIDFSANIRGIWMSVRAGRLDDEGAARRGLLQNIFCALGWTQSESLRYEEGRIAESRYFDYGILRPSAFPAVNITFSADDGENAGSETINELPYCVIPAAYMQALTQACGHHFEAIPVNALDIWQAVAGYVQPRGEKSEKGEPKG
jgi:CO/xanthine dehydrogenase Mo-binding subunit